MLKDKRVLTLAMMKTAGEEGNEAKPNIDDMEEIDTFVC